MSSLRKRISRVFGSSEKSPVPEPVKDQACNYHDPFTASTTATGRNWAQSIKDLAECLRAKTHNFYNLPNVSTSSRGLVRSHTSLSSKHSQRSEARSSLRSRRNGPYRCDDPQEVCCKFTPLSFKKAKAEGQEIDVSIPTSGLLEELPISDLKITVNSPPASVARRTDSGVNLRLETFSVERSDKTTLACERERPSMSGTEMSHLSPSTAGAFLSNENIPDRSSSWGNRSGSENTLGSESRALADSGASFLAKLDSLLTFVEPERSSRHGLLFVKGNHDEQLSTTISPYRKAMQDLKRVDHADPSEPSVSEKFSSLRGSVSLLSLVPCSTTYNHAFIEPAHRITPLQDMASPEVINLAVEAVNKMNADRLDLVEDNQAKSTLAPQKRSMQDALSPKGIQYAVEAINRTNGHTLELPDSLRSVIETIERPNRIKMQSPSTSAEDDWAFQVQVRRHSLYHQIPNMALTGHDTLAESALRAAIVSKLPLRVSFPEDLPRRQFYQTCSKHEEVPNCEPPEGLHSKTSLTSSVAEDELAPKALDHMLKLNISESPVTAALIKRDFAEPGNQFMGYNPSQNAATTDSCAITTSDANYLSPMPAPSIYEGSVVNKPLSFNANTEKREVMCPDKMGKGEEVPTMDERCASGTSSATKNHTEKPFEDTVPCLQCSISSIQSASKDSTHAMGPAQSKERNCVNDSSPGQHVKDTDGIPGIHASPSSLQREECFQEDPTVPGTLGSWVLVCCDQPADPGTTSHASDEIERIPRLPPSEDEGLDSENSNEFMSLRFPQYPDRSSSSNTKAEHGGLWGLPPLPPSNWTTPDSIPKPDGWSSIFQATPFPEDGVFNWSDSRMTDLAAMRIYCNTIHGLATEANWNHDTNDPLAATDRPIESECKERPFVAARLPRFGSSSTLSDHYPLRKSSNASSTDSASPPSDAKLLKEMGNAKFTFEKAFPTAFQKTFPIEDTAEGNTASAATVSTADTTRGKEDLVTSSIESGICWQRFDERILMNNWHLEKSPLAGTAYTAAKIDWEEIPRLDIGELPQEACGCCRQHWIC